MQSKANIRKQNGGDVALDLDFKLIREHRGNQNCAVKKPCCQLTVQEDPATVASLKHKSPVTNQAF